MDLRATELEERADRFEGDLEGIDQRFKALEGCFGMLQERQSELDARIDEYRALSEKANETTKIELSKQITQLKKEKDELSKKQDTLIKAQEAQFKKLGEEQGKLSDAINNLTDKSASQIAGIHGKLAGQEFINETRHRTLSDYYSRKIAELSIQISENDSSTKEQFEKQKKEVEAAFAKFEKERFEFQQKVDANFRDVWSALNTKKDSTEDEEEKKAIQNQLLAMGERISSTRSRLIENEIETQLEIRRLKSEIKAAKDAGKTNTEALETKLKTCNDRVGYLQKDLEETEKYNRLMFEKLTKDISQNKGNISELNANLRACTERIESQEETLHEALFQIDQALLKASTDQKAGLEKQKKELEVKLGHLALQTTALQGELEALSENAEEDKKELKAYIGREIKQSEARQDLKVYKQLCNLNSLIKANKGEIERLNKDTSENTAKIAELKKKQTEYEKEQEALTRKVNKLQKQYSDFHTEFQKESKKVQEALKSGKADTHQLQASLATLGAQFKTAIGRLDTHEQQIVGLRSDDEKTKKQLKQIRDLQSKFINSYLESITSIRSQISNLKDEVDKKAARSELADTRRELIVKIEEERRKLDSRIDMLELSKDANRFEIQQLKERQEELDKNSAKLRDDLEKDVEELRGELSTKASTEDLAAYQESVDALSSAAAEFQDALVKERRGLNLRIISLEQDTVANKEEIEKLNNKVKGIDNDLQTHKSETIKSLADIAKKLIELDETKADRFDVNTLREDLEARMGEQKSDLEGQINSNLSQIDALRQHIELLNEKVESHDKTKEEIRAQVQAAKAEIEKLQKDNVKTQESLSQISGIEEKLEGKLNTELEKLRKEFEEKIKRQSDDLSTHIAAYNRFKSETEGKVKTLRYGRRLIRNQIKRIDNQIALLSDKADENKDGIEQLQKAKTDLTKRQKALETQHSSMEESLNSLVSKVNGLGKDVKSLKTDTAKDREHLNSLAQELDDMRQSKEKEMGELRKQIEAAETLIKSTELTPEEKEKNQQEIKGLQARQKKLEEALRKTNKALGVVNGSLVSGFEDVKKSISSLASATEENRTASAENRAEIAANRAEIAQQKEAMQQLETRLTAQFRALIPKGDEESREQLTRVVQDLAAFKKGMRDYQEQLDSALTGIRVELKSKVDVTTYSEGIEKINGEIAGLKDLLAEARSHNPGTESLKPLQDQIKALERELKEKTDEAVEAAKKASEQAKKASEQAKKAAKKAGEASHKADETAKRVDKLEELSEASKDIESTINALQERIGELEQEEKDSSSKTNPDLQSQIIKLNEQIEALKSSKGEIEEQIMSRVQEALKGTVKQEEFNRLGGIVGKHSEAINEQSKKIALLEQLQKTSEQQFKGFETELEGIKAENFQGLRDLEAKLNATIQTERLALEGLIGEEAEQRKKADKVLNGRINSLKKGVWDKLASMAGIIAEEGSKATDYPHLTHLVQKLQQEIEGLKRAAEQQKEQGATETNQTDIKKLQDAMQGLLNRFGDMEERLKETTKNQDKEITRLEGELSKKSDAGDLNELRDNVKKALRKQQNNLERQVELLNNRLAVLQATEGADQSQAQIKDILTEMQQLKAHLYEVKDKVQGQDKLMEAHLNSFEINMKYMHLEFDKLNAELNDLHNQREANQGDLRSDENLDKRIKLIEAQLKGLAQKQQKADQQHQKDKEKVDELSTRIEGLVSKDSSEDIKQELEKIKGALKHAVSKGEFKEFAGWVQGKINALEKSPKSSNAQTISNELSDTMKEVRKKETDATEALIAKARDWATDYGRNLSSTERKQTEAINFQMQLKVALDRFHAGINDANEDQILQLLDQLNSIISDLDQQIQNQKMNLKAAEQTTKSEAEGIGLGAERRKKETHIPEYKQALFSLMFSNKQDTLQDNIDTFVDQGLLAAIKGNPTSNITNGLNLYGEETRNVVGGKVTQSINKITMACKNNNKYAENLENMRQQLVDFNLQHHWHDVKLLPHYSEFIKFLTAKNINWNITEEQKKTLVDQFIKEEGHQLNIKVNHHDSLATLKSFVEKTFTLYITFGNHSLQAVNPSPEFTAIRENWLKKYDRTLTEDKRRKVLNICDIYELIKEQFSDQPELKKQWDDMMRSALQSMHSKIRNEMSKKTKTFSEDITACNLKIQRKKNELTAYLSLTNQKQIKREINILIMQKLRLRLAEYDKQTSRVLENKYGQYVRLKELLLEEIGKYENSKGNFNRVQCENHVMALNTILRKKVKPFVDLETNFII